MSVNAAHQKRNPWRNTGGHGATIKQKNMVRLLERLSNSPEHDLDGMSRLDVSDYIFLLERRARKQGARTKQNGTWREAST